LHVGFHEKHCRIRNPRKSVALTLALKDTNIFSVILITKLGVYS
jgi:hypothetical protein